MARGPPGTMVRAPSQLRISKTLVGPEGTEGPPGGQRSGPFLNSRRGPPGGGSGAGAGGGRMPGRGGEFVPRMRERKPAGKSAKGGKGAKSKSISPEGELSMEEGMSDGMVQHLLRLQRKEWDQVPYVPKYAHGSQAAAELMTEGKALFEGEKPPGPKVWTRLDKRIGVVGMHGA
ncbi:hypothetical protein K504DRAFT_458241 [Pleomassaria siparia CBS 279.74]|uniref:Uncharacterized protein n=1 Tax=Pleomassaria siparia CBS 279.74 TaxID=1314801 RepID=A0A6G1K5F7_9PLEO|nr:hypothetical protein K504DRAFT_458241 [Pleomassaria siparia CBS 279.74]